jgi:hypothetical protein
MWYHFFSDKDQRKERTIFFVKQSEAEDKEKEQSAGTRNDPSQ